MVWADWGAVIRIERAFMDGSNRKRLVYQGLSTPSGLTVDKSTKLYWTDADLSSISFINLDGSGRKTLLCKCVHFGLTPFITNYSVAKDVRKLTKNVIVAFFSWN